MAKPKVKTVDETVGKWVEVTPARATYYEKYASIAGEEWAARTKAAAPNYKAAVTAPDIDKRFIGGITKAGPEKYNRKIKDVGVARYGPGITAAKQDFQNEISWVLATIAATDLPERKPRGDPANYERVKAIGTALNKARIAKKVAT
ncbi:MAG: hypothetical protein ABIM21_00485 [candidate division WOR-3 bacterium]